jgi:hypothetical protein
LDSYPNGFAEGQCVNTPRGNELPADSTGKTVVSKNGGATGGAVNSQPLPSSDVVALSAGLDLALLIDRWPTLPVPTKEAIMSSDERTSFEATIW